VSEQNVELHRRTIEMFNARDVEAFIALCEPQIEFHSTFAAVGGGVYNGHDGLRRWFRDFEDVWGDEFRIEAEAYFDLGEQTLTFYVLHGRGKQSGAEVALPTAVVARWRDGLCVYFKAYAHREDALSDLGVSEDALEPIAP
jgi:ketosteroid isomerase-like protein